ncbi:MAG TPA: AbrB/MazE/SpoVT family DNA-binding domain-containing protein [Burkholderiaceae bacterium]|nr:AbrB/MazE/SpoVT family DNA-binding domain-containing protein [Burkholderiaceae bacterium]
MLATVSIKGQVTVPKAIRDRLNIEQGTQLDFKLNDDGSISVRPLNRSALAIVGLLKRPGRAPVSVEQMNRAAGEAAALRHERSRRQK